ncbi:MAG: hypothetical protein IRZ16_23945 [Myxococcaceae bacterium]|nr:hypothetical protein [Myxococcaceae bacterium]
MRLVLPIAVAAVAFAACGTEDTHRIPPLETFYFPTAVAHADKADPGSFGTLYVASSDFDKRYDFGAVTAVDLDAIDWSSATGEKKTISDLKLTEAQRVLTSPFAGLAAAWCPPTGSVRLILPTRAEFDRLFAVDADGTALSCANSQELPFGDQTVVDCTPGGVSLTQPGLDAPTEPTAAGFAAGKPRAPAPFAAAVSQDDGAVFVTHLTPADSPANSSDRLESFVVTGNADEPETIGDTASDFISIGTLPSAGVAVGRRYAYVTGRSPEAPFTATIPPALRMVDRQSPSPRRLEVNLETSFRAFDARGIALFPEGPGAIETRAFMLVRGPDALLVLSIEEAQSDFPRVSLVRAVLLPSDPTSVVLVPRGADRGALVAIACTGADALALYDDETGQLASVITDVGRQPFGIAVDARPSAVPGEPGGARLYVSNFEDSTVGVVEIPNVNRPSEAKLVATLGRNLVCFTQPDSVACDEETR